MDVRWELRRVRPVKVADVRGGRVKIVGRLRVLEPLVAPISHRICACYDCSLHERRGEALMTGWVTVLREVDQRDFLLVDETGTARIEVAGMRALAGVEATRVSGPLKDVAPQLDPLLARHGEPMRTWVFPGDAMYEERALEAGELVTACGIAEQEVDPNAAAGYRDTPMRWVLRGAPGADLLVSDDPETFG